MTFELEAVRLQVVKSKAVFESLLQAGAQQCGEALLASTHRILTQEELDNICNYQVLEGRLMCINAVLGLLG